MSSGVWPVHYFDHLPGSTAFHKLEVQQPTAGRYELKDALLLLRKLMADRHQSWGKKNLTAKMRI